MEWLWFNVEVLSVLEDIQTVTLVIQEAIWLFADELDPLWERRLGQLDLVHVVLLHVVLELLLGVAHLFEQVDERLLEVLELLVFDPLLVNIGLNIQKLALEQLWVLLDIVFDILH